MSLNQLIADNPKGWLDIRVNTLKTDSGIEFGDDGSSGYLLNTFISQDFSCQIEGTLLNNPIPVDVNFIKIGRMILMTVQAFTITIANQNVLGGDLYLTGPFDANLLPITVVHMPMVIQGVNGSDKLSDMTYDPALTRFQIEDEVNGPIFSAAGTNNMSIKQANFSFLGPI